MVSLGKVDQFGASEEDKKLIYTTFVKSCLEQRVVVWTSSLPQENKEDLKRLQRNAVWARLFGVAVRPFGGFDDNGHHKGSDKGCVTRQQWYFLI